MRDTIRSRVDVVSKRISHYCSCCCGDGFVVYNDIDTGNELEVDCENCGGTGLDKPPTADIEAMWKAVSKEKVDTTALLALADALHENGDLDTASTLDWCVQRKRWPKKKQDSWNKRKFWGWSPSSVSDTPKNFGHGLPRPVHEFVDHDNDTLKEAIESLNLGLVTLRELLPNWRR